jgi:hypothetical protein
MDDFDFEDDDDVKAGWYLPCRWGSTGRRRRSRRRNEGRRKRAPVSDGRGSSCLGYIVPMAEQTTPELRYAVQQQRIRDIVKVMFPGGDVFFDTRFKPEAISFTIADAKGQRVGLFIGGTKVSDVEEMTDEEIEENIELGLSNETEMDRPEDL